MKAKYILSLTFLLTISSAVFAKECSDSRTCTVFADSKGAVMYRDGERNTVLMKADDRNAATYTTYVSKRNQKYYLIRESSTNDHSLIIVPIDFYDQSVSFKRVLFLSIDLMKSTQAGHEVWSGSEYNLAEPSRLNQFSWDKAYDWQGKLPASEFKSDKLSHAPGGFSAVRVTVYDGDGKTNGTRTFLYQTRSGLNPDSIICYSNCDFSAASLDGDFIGTIGKHPLHASLNQRDGKIIGHYSYDGKSGKLYLSGNIENGKSATIGEYEKEDEKNETGRFSITKFKPYITGTWVSRRNSAQLPVVLLPDAIYQ